MKKRNFVYFVGALFVFCLLLFGAPRRAEAAYTVSYNSDGSATLKNQSTGGTVAKLSVKGERIGKGIVVTSKNVFYLSYSVGQSKNTYSIIQQNLSTGSKKRLIRLTTVYDSYHIRAIYDGSLYLEATSPGGRGMACRFTVSSKKFEALANGSWAFGYKYRFVIDGSANSGMPSPGTCYVYNTKSRNLTVIATYVLGTGYSGKYAYFASMKSPSESALVSMQPVSYKIIRYDLSTAGKKTLVSSMKAYRVEKITANYVYHSGYKTSTGQNVYYRYNIAKKKNVQISEATYRKAVE